MDSLDGPVLDAQRGDAAKVVPVSSDDDSMILQGNSGDAQVHDTNVEPEGLQLRDARDGSMERQVVRIEDKEAHSASAIAQCTCGGKVRISPGTPVAVGQACQQLASRSVFSKSGFSA